MTTSLKQLGRLVLRSTLASNQALRRPLRTLSHRGLVPKAVWRRLPVDGSFAVSDLGVSFLYESRTGDAVGRALYWAGLSSWEWETVSVFIGLVVRARTFVDIGANTGIYSLLACAASPSVRVIAFEPVERVFDRLCRNVQLNEYLHRCRLRHEACSSELGKATFHVPYGDLPTSASLHVSGFRHSLGTVTDVCVTTVDAACADAGPIDLVKIDVEGFEDRVLSGMPNVLSRWRPALIIECNPDGPYRAVQTILANYGYRFYHLTDRGPQATCDIVPDPQQRFRNYLCLPSELAGANQHA